MKHNTAMMQTAILWSKESYCKKRQVGAVVADGRHPISIGFNGTISGLDNICEVVEPFKSRKEMESHDKKFIVDCPKCNNGVENYSDGLNIDKPNRGMLGRTCKKCNGLGVLKDTNITNDFTLHAEYNAIIRASKHQDLEGTSIYITLAPCRHCSKLIAAHKIKEVFYKDIYKDMSGIEFLESCGVKVTQLDG